MRLPVGTKIVTARQMRELDRRAAEDFGIPSLLLMENAGRAVADAAKELLDELGGARVLVVAGPGNNGGDGFVAARHLYNAGVSLLVAYYGDRRKAKGDALVNVQIAEKMGLEIDAEPHPEEFQEYALRADLIIDALLGTGVKGRLKDPIPAIIGGMNLTTAPVVAVDVPSGVDADTGALLGPALDTEHILQEAVRAAVTVTLGLPKVGLVTYPGAEYVGRLLVADIGIPAGSVEDGECAAYAIGPEDALFAGGPPGRAAHKGDMGHVAVVAGSVGFTGAAALAAHGALRLGAGLVTLAVPESLNDIMEAKLTEAMTVPVPEGSARAFGEASLSKVVEMVNARDAAVIGPGLGRDDDTVRFALELVKRIESPAVVDADGLFAIGRDLAVLDQCKAPLILTPHPGEMARLAGTTIAEVQSNRLEVARSFAQEHEVTVVLKGAGTIVAAPEGDSFINTTGTPGMATGGVGDVLSGMIGALLAQGREPKDAACGAVYLHGRAGELAAEKLGTASMIASDLADALPEAMKEVELDIFERE